MGSLDLQKVSFFDGFVEICLGDITTFEVDAIVNSANTELILGGGVSGAIARAAGKVVQEECDKIGNIGLGEVAITAAGNLKARYIFHAATLSLGTWATTNSVKKALHNVLETAEKLAIKTIAIPALGAGIGALSITKVARIFYDEIKQYLSREKRSLVKVYIVILEKSSFELFIKIMEEMTNANAEQLEE